jgi:hypothetical protein
MVGEKVTDHSAVLIEQASRFPARGAAEPVHRRITLPGGDISGAARRPSSRRSAWGRFSGRGEVLSPE